MVPSDSLSPDIDPSALTIARLRAVLTDSNIEFPTGAKKRELVKLYNRAVGNSRKSSRQRKTRKGAAVELVDVESSDEESLEKRPKTDESSSSEDSSAGIEQPVKEENQNDEAESAPFAANNESDSDVSNSSLSDESTGTVIQRKLTKASSFSQSPSPFVSDLDSGLAFDSALAKIKKDVAADEPRRDTSGDLAKYLGVDQGGIREKPKGKRNITPRRPIVIEERFLIKNKWSDDESEGELDHETQEPQPAIETQSTKTRTIQQLQPNATETRVEVESKTEVPKPQDMSVGSDADSDVDARAEPAQPFSILPALRFLSYLLVWLALLGTLFLGYWYRQQQYLVGYCGQEILRPTVPRGLHPVLASFGDYLDTHLRPECAPCPQHARCFPNLEIACHEDFVEHTPWYFPLFPVADVSLRRCVPDGRKAEKIEIMISVALDLLRARNAAKECGTTPKDSTEAGLSLEELHDLLLMMKAPYITEEEFEELWARLAAELEREPEIIARHVEAPSTNAQDTFRGAQHAELDDAAPAAHVKRTVLRSTATTHLSLRCRVSRTVAGAVVRRKRVLGLLALAGVLVAYVRMRLAQRRRLRRRVEAVYTEVLAALQKNARLEPPYIGSIQLRDQLLESEGHLAKRMRLWEAVSLRVDRNTNVRHSLLEVHGEVMKVWQWIAQVE